VALNQRGGIQGKKMKERLKRRKKGKFTLPEKERN